MGGAAGHQSRGWRPKRVRWWIGVTNCHRCHKGPLSGWGYFSTISCCRYLNMGTFLLFSFFLLVIHRYHSLVHVYNITLVISMEMQAGEIISQIHTNFRTVEWVMTVFHSNPKKFWYWTLQLLNSLNLSQGSHQHHARWPWTTTWIPRGSLGYLPFTATHDWTCKCTIACTIGPRTSQSNSSPFLSILILYQDQPIHGAEEFHMMWWVGLSACQGGVLEINAHAVLFWTCMWPTWVTRADHMTSLSFFYPFYSFLHCRYMWESLSLFLP